MCADGAERQLQRSRRKILPPRIHARMRCDGDPEALSRRRAVASLLIFAKELEKVGRISKASKGLLKGERTQQVRMLRFDACCVSKAVLRYHAAF